MFANRKIIATAPRNKWLAKLATDKHWFWGSLGLGVALVVAAILWIASTLNVVAVVDGHNITKSEYNDMAPRLQKFYEYNGDKESLENLTTSVLDFLVEDKIIHQEARRRGVKADPAEIERQYQGAVEFYGSEEKYKVTIDSLYGWTPELHKQAIERQILQEKLEPLVVAARNGQYIAVQHLPGGGVTTMTEEQYAQRAEKTAQKIKADVDKEDFKKVYDRASDYGDPNNGTDPLLVSAQSYSWVRNQQGVDKEAIDAIYSAVPGSAPVLAKTSTFYGIFKVDSASNGTAKSWEDFVKEYPHKIYANRLGPWYKSIWSAALAVLAPSKVDAAVACDSSRCHASKVYGKVRDAITNSPLNNATVRVFAVGPGANGTPGGLTNPSCLDKPNDPSCKCGPKEITKSTSSTGDYQFGRNDGVNCAVNCYWTYWKGQYSKTGYQSKTENLGNLGNGGETLVNKSLYPLPASVTVVAKATFINGQTGNLDNTRVEAISGPVGGGNTSFTRSQSSGFSATFEAPSEARNGTFVYDMAKGNNGWQGCTSGNQAIRRCGIDLGNGEDKTITVWFKEVETVTDRVTCSGPSSVPKGQIITLTGTGTPQGKSYSWSAPGATGNTIFTYPDRSTLSMYYTTAGSKSATVTYGTVSHACNFTVTDTPQQTSVNCTPNQNPVTVNSGVYFNGSGSTGTYGWSGGGQPASSTNANPFYTVFNSTGTKTVTVTSSGYTSGSCTVNVVDAPSGPPPAQGSQPSGSVDFNQGERPPVY